MTVPFSDPSRPGTVKVNQFQGGIHRDRLDRTRGHRVDRRHDRDDESGPRGDGAGKTEVAGLRRLRQPSGLRIEEENNVMTIGSGRF